MLWRNTRLFARWWAMAQCGGRVSTASHATFTAVTARTTAPRGIHVGTLRTSALACPNAPQPGDASAERFVRHSRNVRRPDENGEVRRKYRPGPFLSMFVATQLVDQVASREFERAGLAPHAIGVLQLIWINEPVTPTQLERITGMRPTTLRDRVNELIERGEVRRVPNPDDG